MDLRILSAKDVIAALPMSLAIEKMKLAFSEYSAGKVTLPLRTRH
jgi:ornithine cyclodeaminase/alanine dehydrogenase-like protein (mu-crystallin family)